MPHIARAIEVQKLFEQDTLGLKAYGASHLVCPLQFQLVQSAADLEKDDLRACLALVEHTSGHDYKASSIGWRPKVKEEEMMDMEMVYLLVRQGDAGAQVEEKAEHGQQNASTAFKSNNTAKHAGGPLNALDRMVCDYASDSEDEDQVPRNDGKILGFMSFMFTYDDPPYQDREIVYMYEIHLEDQLRGRGLGPKLIKFLELAASQNGISKTMLTVFASNTLARRLYEKLGYSKDACSPKDRVVRKRIIEADYAIMSKELA